jgi:hypothetical protein
MALRILLTAMVVSLSLPLPSVDSCRLLVDEMNQELATVLDDVRDEWSPRNLKPLEIALSEELAKIGDLSTMDSGVTEESFTRILDEFAIEALRPEIEQAANHARTIPLEQVNHALPPAVEAIDALPSALELIRSVSEERDAVSVVSESRLWNEIVSDRLTESVEMEFVVRMVHPVVSSDIGPWQWLDEDTAEQSRTSERIAETLQESKVTAHAADSISEEWDRVIRLVAVAESMPEIEFLAPIEPAQAATRDDTKNVTIQDAFRKTAEAIALWSKVMTRAF